MFVAWWHYWVLGRRWLVNDRLYVRWYWWSEWEPVRVVKTARPWVFTDEVIDQAREESWF